MFPDQAVLAVDGGASKVDVALVDVNGRVIGALRRRGSYHFGLGRSGPLQELGRAITAMKRGAGIDHDGRVLARTGVFCLAGADIPLDDRRIAAEIAGQRWTSRTMVRNDTFGVLRAGTDRKWGVAVVCGTGMNCAGIGPDGSSVRFPSLGELSGDRAHGGGWLGRSALGAAIRARDGRGPRTLLERSVPAHFGMSRPTALMEAVYLGKIDYERMSELAPLVLDAAARGDGAAQQMIDEMAEEIIVTANATIRRLHLTRRDVHVVLGGGVLRAASAALVARIRGGIRAVAPDAEVFRLQAPPVLGAALIGLDAMRAPEASRRRLRAALTHRRLTDRR